MADHLGGLSGANFDKPEVLAAAIINAAQARFFKLQPEQIPHNAVGVMAAGASHLCKREERETGSVHAGSPAAKALSEYNKAKIGKGSEVEREVEKLMQQHGLREKTKPRRLIYF